MIANLKGGKYIWRNSVDVASVGASLTISTLVGSVLDGYTITATSRVLLKDQTTSTQNGIYINNALVYEYDNNASSVPHGIYYVINGTLNGGKYYICDSSGYVFTINTFNLVSSVALTMPSIFSVSGSPVTSTGTLAVSLVSETGNTFFAGPNGSSGTPTFRGLAIADLPTYTQNSIIFAGSGGVLSQDNSKFAWNDTSFLMTVAGLGYVSALADSPSTYSTGTIAATASTTVTGTGTTFTSAMVGGILTTGTTKVLITGFTSATSITVLSAITAAAAAFIIYYAGFQVDTAGNTSVSGALYDINGSKGSSGQVLTSTGAGIQWGSGFAYNASTDVAGPLTSTANYSTFTTVLSFAIPALTSGTYYLTWCAEFGSIANSAFIQAVGSVSGTFSTAQNNTASALSQICYQSFTGYKILSSYTGSETFTIGLTNGSYASLDPATARNMRFYIERLS